MDEQPEEVGRRACREAARKALKSMLEEHSPPDLADERDLPVTHQSAGGERG
jgi:hypothetical protein